MAYDEELADRVRAMLPDGTPEKAMFGGLAFLLGGHLSVTVSRSGGLMVRCDPEESATLLLEDGVERMVMRGRPMDGWLLVAPEAVTDEQSLVRWVEVGTAYARSLPPA
ncbi:MAG: uncharacterized protein JWO46_258 [Nocardioidaceae bacterium]|nr:uncharacterized protein [Nocardioidaceae bacterium]